MKTIRVIDLLNKISNGEEVPKKIKYEGIEYTHIDNYCYADKDSKLLSYEIYAEQHRLNDEIEIIEDTPKEEVQVLSRWYPPKEDKKIEKLDNNIAYCDGTYETRWSDSEMYIVDKLNEIIDKVNGEE